MLPLVPVRTHLKDQAGRYPDHALLVPAEGDFDDLRYLRALADLGYRGAVTVTSLDPAIRRS